MKWLLAVAICTAGLASPAMAQAPVIAPEAVDPAAVYPFDPDGASGVALTPERVRAFLALPIPEPTKEQRQAVVQQQKEAHAARTKMLSDPAIYAPRWTENAFELQDGSTRPMTIQDLAVIEAMDAAAAAQKTLDAQRWLSVASQIEREAYADVLASLLEASILPRQHKKVDGSWRRLEAQMVGGQPRVVEQPVSAETEVLLKRYALAGGNLGKTWRDAHTLPSTRPSSPLPDGKTF